MNAMRIWKVPNWKMMIMMTRTKCGYQCDLCEFKNT